MRAARASWFLALGLADAWRHDGEVDAIIESVEAEAPEDDWPVPVDSQDLESQYAPVITTMMDALGPEAKRLLRSVELFEPGARVYVGTTSEGAAAIEQAFPGLDLKLQTTLDKYDSFDREGLQARGKWRPFMMEKAGILRHALQSEGVGRGAWYMDADTFLFAPLPQVDAPVGLRHHRISDYMENTYGKYNGGFLFFRSLDALQVWEEAAPHAKDPEDCCQDQVALDVVAQKSKFAELGCGVGVGWFQMAGEPFNNMEYYDFVRCNGGQLQFKDCTILSMHYHIEDKFGRPLRSRLEKAVRECKHPVLPILLESYAGAPSAERARGG